MEFSLRWVRHGSDEQQQLVQLRRQVLRWPLGLDFSEQQLADEQGSEHLGAWLAGEAVGCLVLAPVAPSTMKMRQVAVSPEWQGHRIGQALVQECERKAAELGASQIVLHARANVVPFYERLGYQTEGDEFEEVTLPHFAMRKRLNR